MPIIVTVSRQLGAGGTQIASRVASLLQLRLVDRQILDRVAEQAGVPEGTAEALDESPAAVKARAAGAAGGPSRSYERLVTDAIREAARRDDALIVGRGAHLILAGRPGLLRVRVMAPVETRVASLMQRLSLSRVAAERAVRESDRSRAKYIKLLYGVDWTDPGQYDLVINTKHVSYEAAAEAIVLVARSLGERPA
jgi:cytidylate kinase